MTNEQSSCWAARWGTALLLLGLMAFGAKAAAQNLALGKPYTLTPAPNYAYCTDPEDAKQLTDGQRVWGYFWTQRGTVGWSGARRVVIRVDLGAVKPIGGVSFNTAAGAAGADWPQSIQVLVSDDGTNYGVAGDLVQLSGKVGRPPSKGYGVFCYRTQELRTHGRYVAFLITPKGPFTFVDEIEVNKGQDDFLSITSPTVRVTNLMDYFVQNGTRIRVERRLREDARALGGADLTNFVGELSDLAQWNAASKVVFPINATHERMFRAQARVWRQGGSTPFSVWAAEPYSPLSLTQAPPQQAKATLSLKLMENEVRAAAFNIANATDSNALARLQIVGVPGGVNPSCIEVREALWTDTASGNPVASALAAATRQGDHFSVKVVPGLTKQIWLTVHTTNVSAGNYSGKVLVSIGDTNLTIPLELRVYPVRFPDRPTLHVGGWDYTDAEAIMGIGPSNREAVIEHLREHFVDSPWATGATLAPGHYDTEGKMTVEPDTARFDSWLGRWPQARQYGVFVNAGEEFDGVKAGTDEFNKKVGTWVRFWADYAKAKGLRPEQLLLHLVDEPTEPKQDDLILAWATAIHASHTGVKVWEDPIHKDPSSANQKMMAACDVLCPDRVMFAKGNRSYRSYFRKWHDQGKELAFYSCSGPSTTLDPYSYYRLQAWTCWVYGAESSYFWAFSDSGGGSSWNEYAAKGRTYVPFFLDATSLTPGKQMEALREGVEDYEYLVLLRKAVAEAVQSGKKGAAVDKAQRLLNEAAARVCDAKGADKFNWSDEKDRTIADAVRTEILEAICALKKQ